MFSLYHNVWDSRFIKRWYSSSSVASEANSNWRGGGGLDFSENLDKQKNKVLIMVRLCLTLQKKFGGVGGRASPWIVAYAVSLWNLTN